MSEKHEFQTEVNQLLQLMIHSLYSNKEIFLRELISNASDACDKLRFQALSNGDLYEDDGDLRVQVEADEAAGTVTVRDNGIGMNHDDVIKHIGTIAKSGTKEFFGNLTGDQAKDSNLIGQFGVGFYSAFIVADKVTLTTRKAGDDASKGVRWESEGKGEFTLDEVADAPRGTEIILHIKDEEKEFLDDWRLRTILSKYSDHIPLPIQMRRSDDDGQVTEEWEVVNQASALWQQSKSDISDDEYKEFYKHVAHDFEDPLAWSHNRVEGKLEYTSLLYIPKRAPFDLWDNRAKHGIKLYVQRVFIMDEAEHFLPNYLRFVKGLVDTNDLPLNVSREILQGNRVTEQMRSALVKRINGMLEKMAKNEPEKYQEFWNQFGRVMKEGPGEDFANREQIAGLCRFASTHNDDDTQNVSLVDYISRMKDGQEKIYFITADNYTAAKNSPHLEVFRKKGIEVLLLSDRVDEWLTGNLNEFDGKTLQSVAKGDLDLSATESEEEKKAQEETEKTSEELIKRMKDQLGERVADVKVSHRLVDSPACIVLGENEMALYMQQLMKQAGQNLPDTKPVLEVNVTHPLVKRIEASNDEQFNEWTSVLFDQAVLAEGGQLDDPAGFVHRLNQLILNVA